MSSPALQSKAQALNAKMEGEAKIVLDDIERTLLRPIARKSYACVVSCYDKAGSKGAPEQLEQCSRQCQIPYQKAHNMVQQEVAQFQDRLNRSMISCNDEAKDMMTADVMDNPSKMTRVEDVVLKCISKTVDTHIGLLAPMKKRIASNLKQI